MRSHRGRLARREKFDDGPGQPAAAPSRRARLGWLVLAGLGWLVALLLLTPRLHLALPLTAQTDLDGLHKLRGIAADPTWRGALGWFSGDDPQGVHTFRPLPAVTLWVEYLLWGYARAPYLLVNLGWLLLTAAALFALGRRLGLPAWAAWLAGLVLLGRPTRGTLSVIGGIATRHDLLCALFALLAFCCLLGYLADGRRSRLAWYAGWSLLAYLSKEMALALVPLGLTVALWSGRWSTPRRRQIAAAGATLAMAAVYLVWYRLAEANMGDFDHPTHTFGGMIGLLLQRNRDMSVHNLLYNLCWPLGDLVRQIVWVHSLSLVFSGVFWRALGLAVLPGLTFWLMWRDARRALGLIYLWKFFTYLPVLPLHDVWGWYEYMPHLLDPLFLAASAAILHRRWARAPRGDGRPTLR